MDEYCEQLTYVVHNMYTNHHEYYQHNCTAAVPRNDLSTLHKELGLPKHLKGMAQ